VRGKGGWGLRWFNRSTSLLPPLSAPPQVLQNYIRGRVEKAGLLKWVRLNTGVVSTTFDAASQKFTVRTSSTVTGDEAVEEFDYVVCCTGHFSTPNVPEFRGAEGFAGSSPLFYLTHKKNLCKCWEDARSTTRRAFGCMGDAPALPPLTTFHLSSPPASGRILHAHDFRSAEEFAGKRVLVVGTSYSAEDIASQCHKYGAASVHCSWRTAPMGWHWPDSFTTVTIYRSTHTSLIAEGVRLTQRLKYSEPLRSFNAALWLLPAGSLAGVDRPWHQDVHLQGRPDGGHRRHHILHGVRAADA